jgi:hypothetical protein
LSVWRNGSEQCPSGDLVHDRQRDVVRAAAARLQAQIERNSDEWLRSEFGSDVSGQADASATVAALGDVLSKQCTGATPSRLGGKRRWDFAADVALEPETRREHIAALEHCEPFRDFVYKVRRIDGSQGPT